MVYLTVDAASRIPFYACLRWPLPFVCAQASTKQIARPRPEPEVEDEDEDDKDHEDDKDEDEDGVDVDGEGDRGEVGCEGGDGEGVVGV